MIIQPTLHEVQLWVRGMSAYPQSMNINPKNTSDWESVDNTEENGDKIEDLITK